MCRETALVALGGGRSRVSAARTQGFHRRGKRGAKSGLRRAPVNAADLVYLFAAVTRWVTRKAGLARCERGGAKF